MKVKKATKSKRLVAKNPAKILLSAVEFNRLCSFVRELEEDGDGSAKLTSIELEIENNSVRASIGCMYETINWNSSIL